MFAGQESLSPAQQQCLNDAAAVLTDEWMMDVASMWKGDGATTHLHSGGVLPARFSGFYDVNFAKRFLTVLITVSWKLAAAEHYELSSVAEELALNALIDAGETRAELFDVPDPDHAIAALQASAFEDRDFEWLFRDDMDGIQDSSAGQLLQMANLNVRDWFVPFADRGHVVPFVL